MKEESREPESDLALISATLKGNSSAFESLIVKYQPRIFLTARRYARKESEVEDIVQEIFLKAYQRLATFRGEAPFEHWLMRLAVRTCYDFLRQHQRNRETVLSDFTEEEQQWLERQPGQAPNSEEAADAARELVHRVLSELPAPARLVITLLEIERKSVKEIAELTGWSVPLVKVRAFRARALMRKCLEKITKEKYL
jgi:RNA polymerase sigma-70 factor (ECF subfamily)